ncbi:hypothetical protein Tco_0411947 [Tanacetum coccineum]
MEFYWQNMLTFDFDVEVRSLQRKEGVSSKSISDSLVGIGSLLSLSYLWTVMMELDIMESTGIFSVASARRRIDEICLPNIGEETRWVKCVPIKINVLAWKIKTDALPTGSNISQCGLVRDIAILGFELVNLDHAKLELYADGSLACSIRMDSKTQKVGFERMFGTPFWC